jgi:hypothetical protein
LIPGSDGKCGHHTSTWQAAVVDSMKKIVCVFRRGELTLNFPPLGVESAGEKGDGKSAKSLVVGCASELLPVKLDRLGGYIQRAIFFKWLRGLPR